MKRVVIFSLIMMACLGASNAQILDRIKNAAQNTVERKTEQKVEEAIDNGFNNNQNRETQEKSENPTQNKVTEDPPQKNIEAIYAKCDFIPGDVVLFEDNQFDEKMGEFPSQWDLTSGSAEIASLLGTKSIYLEAPNTEIQPLMKDMTNYLPTQFTIEADVFIGNPDEDKNSEYFFDFFNLVEENVAKDGDKVAYFKLNHELCWWYIVKPNTGDILTGEFNLNDLIKLNNWNHVAISFNTRALKIYINGSRVANIPAMSQPRSFSISRDNWDNTQYCYISNVKIAKGAVPLYDRMMNDGKIISYGITFDIGKSTIKPESIIEINRIAELMKQNPNVKFSVEGHTDASGNAVDNQKLSEERSRAIVNKLIELGISGDRLKAVGKGQTNPVGDNSTTEGRAKNRRVEFVKMPN